MWDIGTRRWADETKKTTHTHFIILPFQLARTQALSMHVVQL